jgi:hypothetical protein
MNWKEEKVISTIAVRTFEPWLTQARDSATSHELSDPKPEPGITSSTTIDYNKLCHQPWFINNTINNNHKTYNRLKDTFNKYYYSMDIIRLMCSRNYLSSSAALEVFSSALASGVALLAVVAGVTSESLDLLLAVLLASFACVGVGQVRLVALDLVGDLLLSRAKLLHVV